MVFDLVGYSFSGPVEEAEAEGLYKAEPKLRLFAVFSIAFQKTIWYDKGR